MKVTLLIYLAKIPRIAYTATDCDTSLTTTQSPTNGTIITGVSKRNITVNVVDTAGNKGKNNRSCLK